MRGFLTLIFLGAIGSARAAEPECQYDYICEPGNVVGNVGSDAGACSVACAAEDESTCAFWTFTNYRNDPRCYFLTGCDVQTKCSGPQGTCASGPRKCEDVHEDCWVLDYGDVTQYSKTWKCVSGTNPYSASLAPGTVCEISCPTWKDSNVNTFYPGTVVATCDGPGWWVDPQSIKDGDGIKINPIDSPTPNCFCLDITIPPNTLEVGENGGGAELYINNIKQDNMDKEIVIHSGDHVVLLCDRHPVMDFSCLSGLWSQEVHDCTDIYCYNPPDSCDGTPQTTTTTATPPGTTDTTPAEH